MLLYIFHPILIGFLKPTTQPPTQPPFPVKRGANNQFLMHIDII